MYNIYILTIILYVIYHIYIPTYHGYQSFLFPPGDRGSQNCPAKDEGRRFSEKSMGKCDSSVHGKHGFIEFRYNVIYVGGIYTRWCPIVS